MFLWLPKPFEPEGRWITAKTEVCWLRPQLSSPVSLLNLVQVGSEPESLAAVSQTRWNKSGSQLSPTKQESISPFLPLLGSLSGQRLIGTREECLFLSLKSDGCWRGGRLHVVAQSRGCRAQVKTELYDEDAERRFCSGYQLTLLQCFSARTVGRVGESQAHPLGFSLCCSAGQQWELGCVALTLGASAWRIIGYMHVLMFCCITHCHQFNTHFLPSSFCRSEIQALRGWPLC